MEEREPERAMSLLDLVEAAEAKEKIRADAPEYRSAWQCCGRCALVPLRCSRELH